MLSATASAPTSSSCQSTVQSTKSTLTTSKATCGSSTLVPVVHMYQTRLVTPGRMKKAQYMCPGNPMANWFVRPTPCVKMTATSSNPTFWSIKSSAKKSAMTWLTLLPVDWKPSLSLYCPTLSSTGKTLTKLSVSASKKKYAKVAWQATRPQAVTR